ncbi:MAG: pyruvate, phosphate dikinase [Spirochaetales bacterium]|nr:MAG: pyruvate, phosphate dikinase [Spirochaetales bacterium]
MSNQYVYYFGGGKAEGRAQMKELLGGKGANLAEMTNLGIPVPPGFTISTEACAEYYKNNRQHNDDVKAQVAANLEKLEKEMGKKLGDGQDPLLVSVRSGAAVSMPGMMDTVLNLGLNAAAVEGISKNTGNDRFAWDAYRRFIQMYGDVVMGVAHHEFEEALDAVKKAKGVENDLDLDAADLQKVVDGYMKVYEASVGKPFPQDPMEQLWGAVDAVFGSWNNERAIKYRNINKIGDLLGTAVNVQSMVFGNWSEESGTGVCFSRDPSTGENYFYGEYLMNAQGEDVVAGIRTPQPLSALEDTNAAVYKQLVEVKDRLEKHYTDMQDMEFTIQDGKLFLLQTRNGKRTGKAAVKVAVDLTEEGMISKETAVTRVTADQMDQLLHPMIAPAVKKTLKPIAQGLEASPGAAVGKVVFNAEDAETWVARGEKVVLVRKETSPEDIGGMHVSEGILTSTGGMTSHAAVVARGMGTPCVAGCKSVIIDEKAGKFTVGGVDYKEGDFISLDGSDGNVYAGKVELEQPKLGGELNKLLGWADEIRHGAKRPGVADGFFVRTNADLPEDARRAVEFGAEGIGLTRTEHMFFEEDKLKPFRRMIVAENHEERWKALQPILDLQIKDFKGIFEAMDGRPVTVRLLDPPLHEFVPHTEAEVRELAAELGKDADMLVKRVSGLKELNPMLGHRGCRLGITYPEVYDMQVEAIMKAAAEVAASGTKVNPEIMIPLVGTAAELRILRANAQKVIDRVLKETGASVNYLIGTMIEIPRAALTADQVAEHADFFSFGTNDLTQMTFGYSRDDVGSFVPQYVEQKILKNDPFQSLDTEGVGQLVAMGVTKGRSLKSALKTGICGEHGGDPASIAFCYGAGLNYVSCSPFRVPIARLAAAQAVVASK